MNDEQAVIGLKATVNLLYRILFFSYISGPSYVGAIKKDKYEMFTLFFNKFAEINKLERTAKTIIDIFSATGGIFELLFVIFHLMILKYQEYSYQKSVIKKLFRI